MQHNTRALAILLMLTILTIIRAQAQDHPAPVQPFTLDEVWQRAGAHNKTLQQALLRLEKSEEQLKNTRAERLPEISAKADYARISNMPVFESGLFESPTQTPIIHKTYTAGADAYLNLYSGHQLKTKITAEEVSHQLAVVEKNQTASEIKLRVAALYLDLQRSLIFKDLILKNIGEGEKRLEEIRELHKNGVVLRSDLLRGELQLSKQKMTLVEIDNNLLLANQQLDLMIGLPETVAIQPTGQGPEPDLSLGKSYDDYLQQAFAQAYPVKISEKEKELSSLHLKEVQARARPTLGLFANYKYSYPQIFLYPYADAGYTIGMAGLKASYNISSLYHNKHQTAAARIEVKKQQVAHADTEDQVRRAVKENFVRYEESRKRIEVALLNIKQATENYRIVRNTYFNQTALVTDLLDADTQLLQSRFDLAAAQLASRLLYYQLLNATGQL
jgi:outer membrane protein TolC